MADMISLLNTIRANASAEYQNTVPVATQTNFTTVGNSILSYAPNQNEFCDALVNRIAFTIVNQKRFNNPLSVLKKGGIPLGQDIQEIYTNPAKGGTYSADSTNLLTVFKSDTKSAYYRLNRQGKFTVTVSLVNLQRAFVSMQDLDNFIQSIINSMYNGDEIEQFELTKNLMANAFDNGMITEVKIYDAKAEPNLTDKDIAYRLVKQIQTYSEILPFPSTSYNKFASKKGNGAPPVKTWTPKSDQILIIPASVKTAMNVEILASAFNKSYVEMEGMILTVDSFVGSPILGILCDKSCFQIYENLFQLKSFENGDTLAINYFLHHWQTYGFSLLANSICFTYAPATVTLTLGSLGTAGDEKITGLTASAAYIVTVDDDETPVSKTTNSSGEITGLSNNSTYFVKLP